MKASKTAARFLGLLFVAALRARAGVVDAAPREVPRLVMPGASFNPAAGPGILLSPSAPTLVVGAAPSLIIPAAPVIAAPSPTIIVAARAMTEEEAAPAKPLSGAELKKLAESLAPARDEIEKGPSDAERARSLDAAFDGKLAPEASAWDDLSERFTRGPLAPDLPYVANAARSLIARLVPSLYRRVPTAAAYDRSEHPMTGHTWTPENGHLIEISPVRADSNGAVPSAFGVPGKTLVQQKIEHLMEYAHEYFHVLFDSAVKRKENHAPHSVYSAMTEGFAVSGEQLLAESLIDHVPALGLGPRDAMDLVAIAQGRREWLDVTDNHYSEGIIAWRKAYEEGGTRGMLTFLASLSAKRMVNVPRSDPAYQLVLGDHKLLAAYLGHDHDNPLRRGLDAFAKAARGVKLTEDEARDAAVAVEKAGPDGWRRLFERTLLSDKRVAGPKAEADTMNWWEKKPEPMASVEPVFALARLSPAAGAALAGYLAATISERGGAVRLFERPGPNEKLNAIVAGAESLPWDEAGRKTWNDGLMRWFVGTN